MDDEQQRLLELASEGKQRAWWQPLALPYSTYVGLEAEAAAISDFGLGRRARPAADGRLRAGDRARGRAR